MLQKCHYHLHPLAKSRSHITLTRELVNRKLLIFNQYQVDIKDIKCPLQWWEKHETTFFKNWIPYPSNFGDCWTTNKENVFV
jgi:hypothetical protein